MNFDNIVFSLFKSNTLVDRLCSNPLFSKGNVVVDRFPDGESYLQFQSDVKDKIVWVVDSLDRPDDKLMPLVLFAETARTLRAKCVKLISPYLPYMRQDKVFHPGEALSANIFAKLISQYFDELITIDPHLHRIKHLEDIYSIPTKVLSATKPMVRWIKANVPQPLLIGPDEESAQWVKCIAHGVGAPWIILEKTRKSAQHVEVRMLQEKLANYRHLKPVLIDDILSTGGTLLKAADLLKERGFQEPVCVCVHAVYAQGVQTAQLPTVITCNTIPHKTNAIDISPLLGEYL